MNRWMTRVPHQINCRLQLSEIFQLAFSDPATDETVDPIQVLGILLQEFICEQIPFDTKIDTTSSNLSSFWPQVGQVETQATLDLHAAGGPRPLKFVLLCFSGSLDRRSQVRLGHASSRQRNFLMPKSSVARLRGQPPHSWLFAGECTRRYDSKNDQIDVQSISAAI